jgi:hypothetical protein
VNNECLHRLIHPASNPRLGRLPITLVMEPANHETLFVVSEHRHLMSSGHVLQDERAA